jgi:HlyD family secretion protein
MAVLILIVGGFAFLKGKTGSDYIFIEAKKGTLFQEVSVSGRLKPSQSLDLGFEVSGKVSRIFKKAGDEVYAGERLIELDNSQLLSQRAQAEASLEAEESRLEELEKGTRLEELEAARNNVSGLEKSLAEAKTNQEAVKNKVSADLENAYSSALASLQKSVSSSKTVIYSPISGVITKREVEIGESIIANTPIVSLISASGFSAEGGPASGWEIETRVAEVDIAKIKIGDPAKATLDAYGSDVIFQAKVVKIDPAETMVEGLPTYRVTLQFVEKDDRLRSGMTADVDILTAEKQDVILIPQRAVISANSDKLVRVLEKGNQVKEVKVKTGLRGSSGEIEILEGLSEGDKVITSMPGK